MTRRDIIWKWTSYGVVLALVVLGNYFVLNRLPLGAVPRLPLVTAVAVGVLEGARAGAGFGMAAGLVLSAATHGSPWWIALLALIGWLCGLLTQYALRRDIWGFLPACLTAALLCEGSAVLWRLLAAVAALPALLQVALPELLWTIAFSLPIYAMCHFCCRHFGRIFHE